MLSFISLVEVETCLQRLFSLLFTGDGLILKTPGGGDLSASEAGLLPIIFSFGPFRVSSRRSYSLFCGLGD